MADEQMQERRARGSGDLSRREAPDSPEGGTGPASAATAAPERRSGTDRRKENRGWAARPVRSGIDRRVSPEHETWSVEEGDLWRPRCSCGWVSESVYSPVRRARQEEANHRRAALRASQQEQDGAAVPSVGAPAVLFSGTAGLS